MLSKSQQQKPLAYRFLLFVPVVLLLFASTAFTDVLAQQTSFKEQQQERLLENPGIIYASTIYWSAEDKEVYLHGKNVKIKHGDNNFHLNGTGSYLGQVEYLVFNGEAIQPDTKLEINGRKCDIVKLSPSAARAKYGAKAKIGAVVIAFAD